MNRIKKWIMKKWFQDQINEEIAKGTAKLQEWYEREYDRIEPRVRLQAHNDIVNFIGFAQHYLDRTYSNTQLIWLAHILILKNPYTERLMHRQEGKSTVLVDFGIYMLYKIIHDKNRDILVIGGSQRMLDHMRNYVQDTLQKVLAKIVTDKALHYSNNSDKELQPSDFEYRVHGRYQIILRKSNNRINFFPYGYQVIGYSPVLVILDEWFFFKQEIDEEEERIDPFALFQNLFPKALIVGLSSDMTMDRTGPYRPYHWAEEAWNKMKQREKERFGVVTQSESS